MICRLVRELAEDADLQVDVTMACRVLKVCRSGYYEWLGRAPSDRQVADEALIATIAEMHEASRGTYGAPRGCTLSSGSAWGWRAGASGSPG
jgi:hypothetical protein